VAAKALMTEAVSWSVMKWLREKKRVRKTADQANATLDQLNQAVKDRWPDALRIAYKALAPQGAGIATVSVQSTQPIDQQSSLSAKKVKEADDAAYGARMDAEETFDEAERQLSTRLAREGCRKAIQSWELHEKAIRRAEALVPSQ
jgi:Flp pilus assembly protein TadG